MHDTGTFTYRSPSYLFYGHAEGQFRWKEFFFTVVCWGVTKRCRLSLMTNSALVYESQCGGIRGVAGSQPMSTAVHITCHGAQINFGDLTPYLTYGCSNKMQCCTFCRAPGFERSSVSQLTWRKKFSSQTFPSNYFFKLTFPIFFISLLRKLSVLMLFWIEEIQNTRILCEVLDGITL